MSDADTILARFALLAQESIKPGFYDVNNPSITPDTIHLLAVPQGNGKVEMQGIKRLVEEWRQYPERIRSTTTALTLDSFMHLVDRHKTPDSVLFSDVVSPAPSLTAFIDYHTVDKSDPRHLEHRIVYHWPASREWKLWSGKNGNEFGQAEWAEFLEERIPDVSAPTDEERAQWEGMFQTRIALPTEILVLARGLTMTAENKVREIRNLQTGEASLAFEETHRDASGAPLIVPGLFVIQIPLFDGAPASRVLVRLRYRRKEAAVRWRAPAGRASWTAPWPGYGSGSSARP